MSDVPTIYRDHLTAVTGTGQDRIRELWEPDGVVEFPYGGSVGVPARVEGVDAIAEYFGGGHSPFADWSFGEVHGWKIEGADEYVIETHGSATIVASGAPYEQDYIVRFGLAPSGRLAWMREFWDPSRA